MHRAFLFLFCLSLACVPDPSPSPEDEGDDQAPAEFLEECGISDPACELADFANHVDSPEVRAIFGEGGRARGIVGIATEGVADVDVVRIVAAPGLLLRLSLRPGSLFGADLRPFLTVVDRQGEVLGLADGSAALLAEVLVVVPRSGEVFGVISDARNEAGAVPPVGGNALDYELGAQVSLLEAAALGRLSPPGVLTAQGSLLAPGDLALFSFQAEAGERVTLEVAPAEGADEAFRPFFTVYAPSFDLGATGSAPERGQAASRSIALFGEGETSVLVGVSDFAGAGGTGFTFELRIASERL